MDIVENYGEYKVEVLIEQKNNKQTLTSCLLIFTYKYTKQS